MWHINKADLEKIKSSIHNILCIMAMPSLCVWNDSVQAWMRCMNECMRKWMNPECSAKSFEGSIGLENLYISAVHLPFSLNENYYIICCVLD